MQFEKVQVQVDHVQLCISALLVEFKITNEESIHSGKYISNKTDQVCHVKKALNIVSSLSGASVFKYQYTEVTPVSVTQYVVKLEITE